MAINIRDHFTGHTSLMVLTAGPNHESPDTALDSQGEGK